MSNPQTGAEMLRTMARDLSKREKPANQPDGTRMIPPEVMHKLLPRVVYTSQILYSGFGRQITPEGQDPYGIHVAGYSYTNSEITDAVHFYFNGDTNEDGVSQNFGSFDFSVHQSGKVSVSAYETNHGKNMLATLAQPLGSFVVSAITQKLETNAVARAKSELPPIEPIQVTPEDLAPVAAFLEDPANRETFFAFNSDGSGGANGIIVVPAEQ